MALVSGPTVGNAISDPRNVLPKLVTDMQDDKTLINEIFLRILNRSATDAEINATIAAINNIDADHAALMKEVAEREAFWAVEKPKLEKEREDAEAAE